MLFGTFIHILTSLIRDFCTSDRNFASTFFQIPPHDGHPWSWLVVGHCDYNPHNRLSLSRYMPCPAYHQRPDFSGPFLISIQLDRLPYLQYDLLFVQDHIFLDIQPTSFYSHHPQSHILLNRECGYLYLFHES